MAKLARALIGLGLALSLAACQALGATPPAEPVTLRFTYWGSPVEKEAIERMVRAFEAANPDIRVDARHYPNAEYLAQVSAMLASGDPPDVGYLFETHAAEWASQGKVLDLTDVFHSDPDLAARLPETYYYFAPGRTLGTSTASEIVLLFYNRAVFDRAGLPYPPARAEEAWTWDEFVAVARQLTVDVNGRHPGEPGFDPDQVQTYGVSFDKDFWYGYFPFIYSNGGAVVDEAGRQLLLDSPAAVEAVQRLADLMWVDGVMPTPERQSHLPASDALLQTGQLAMDIRGQWKLLDYASLQGLDLGVAVLPKFKEPRTVILGSPTVIFAGTRDRAAALKFYKFHNDPRAVDLYARGLWMPLQRDYYTNPDLIAAWLNNPAHPAEARTALVDYALCCVVRSPHYDVKNFGRITTEIIQPALDRVWAGQAAPAAALAEAVQAAAPLLAGRWDR
ncbi:MAG: sugar ABC transporter substrate-binding protein [Anaerolineales bacterium]|nr:sugar ABC transporter substrate-binding protein [Anaerolineales bacterium]